MLVFDQLKKNDVQLQMLALVIFCGMVILAVGLWWVQIVHVRDYQTSSEIQSSRTVRLPSVRGKVLDRNGEVLAENRAVYNISVYIEDLTDSFKKEYQRIRPTNTVAVARPFWKRWLGVGATTKPIKLNRDQVRALEWQARFSVMSRVAQQLSDGLQLPALMFDTNGFIKHYTNRLALPFPIVKNATAANVARFQELLAGNIAADIEIQSRREYPYSNTASHVLGYLRRDDARSTFGEDAVFSYRLPDYRGVVGIEGALDAELCGRAGTKSVTVNNRGYRQSESITSPAEAGHNVVLTIDTKVQRAAESSLRRQIGPTGRGAVVVMDVESGDILALASNPTFDPGMFIRGFSDSELTRWSDESLGLQKNRATYEIYQAGSTFKTIVALAALENGLKPDEIYRVEPDPQNGGRGAYFIGRYKWRDTAAPGPYNLQRAIVRSSNSYFIAMGSRPGTIDRTVTLAHSVHLGEKIGLPLMQESAGHFPSLEKVRSAKWNDGDTANICIGQGQMDVTPMQMAVVTSALANGGKVLKPRLVARLESQDLADVEPPTVFPNHQLRNYLGVSPHSMQALREAMLAETEDPIEGTGKHVKVPGMHWKVCGKTGTAERDERDERGVKKNTTWFISYAPYEKPRYAVVVAVENGASGGTTCSPVAGGVYVALQDMENPPAKTLATTR